MRARLNLRWRAGASDKTQSAGQKAEEDKTRVLNPKTGGLNEPALFRVLGKALLQAAQSQKQLEDLAKWCQRGIYSFEDYSEIFKTSYALDQVDEDSPDFYRPGKKRKKISEVLREYLHIFGVVPREEYAELARRHEELQAKVAEQEETIKPWHAAGRKRAGPGRELS